MFSFEIGGAPQLFRHAEERELRKPCLPLSWPIPAATIHYCPLPLSLIASLSFSLSPSLIGFLISLP